MSVDDVSNSMGGGDGTQGSAMAQEDLGKGKTWTTMEQIVGNGSTNRSGQRQHPLAPGFCFSQPDLGRSPGNIANLQAAYFLIAQAECCDEQKYRFVP